MNENPPTVNNWPQKSGTYKVVQFERGSQPYLRIAEKPESRDFHEWILKRFAQETGVQCTRIHGPDGPVAALPEDGPYRMTGAGKCDIDVTSKTARFYDHSHDYYKGIDREHLQKLRDLISDWTLE